MLAFSIGIWNMLPAAAVPESARDERWFPTCVVEVLLSVAPVVTSIITQKSQEPRDSLISTISTLTSISGPLYCIFFFELALILLMESINLKENLLAIFFFIVCSRKTCKVGPFCYVRLSGFLWMSTGLKSQQGEREQ